jgi:hypothetical protein
MLDSLDEKRPLFEGGRVNAAHIMAATLRQGRQRAKLWLLRERTLLVHEECRHTYGGNVEKLGDRRQEFFHTWELLP